MPCSIDLEPLPLPHPTFVPTGSRSHSRSSSMSSTPGSTHFVTRHVLEVKPLRQSPQKTFRVYVQAIMATALFRIYPTLIFMGAWSTMVVSVSKFTSADLGVPSTLLTALGVLLGLTLNYRTSSAYERYNEGRRMWSQIILASRTWARMVWIHCPDSASVTPPEDPEARAKDQARCEIEKATLVRMALAFAVAVKHYLRGEESIYYEDLYDLVNFIPSLAFPSGIPDASQANIAAGPPTTSHHDFRTSTVDALSSTDSPISKYDDGTSIGAHQYLDTANGYTPGSIASSTPPRRPRHSRYKSYSRPALMPAMNPPKSHISSKWPFRLFLTRQQEAEAAAEKLLRQRLKSSKSDDGGSHNIPLEITLYMSTYVYALQKRKTIDVPTINSLLAALAQLSDALCSLERILTTPIPWSYNAHIWEVTWVYCLFLPFQLYDAGFGWVTIPAVVLTSYIVVGFAAIGEEIENPFGYDANDLNSDYFCEQIIKRELAVITSKPVPHPEEWVFYPENQTIGGMPAPELVKKGMGEVRRRLKKMGRSKTMAVPQKGGEQMV